MDGKMIVVHSYKGGTGKTLTSVNLATTLAKKGKKTCLLDLDFRAPSLDAIFKLENKECWINDYLNRDIEINDALIDASETIDYTGELFLGLANPATDAIREMSAKDRKWEMRALGRLLALRESLLKDNFDYLILDTSPGLQYSSINAIVAADLVILTTTLDQSDVKGSKRMLRELYDLFEKKTGIIFNKVILDANENLQAFEKRINQDYSAPVLGTLPCFCEVTKAQGSFIFTHQKADHPFSNIFRGITNRMIEVAK